jgi:c-di-GMP-binding flagellar brake protein YcgR
MSDLKAALPRIHQKVELQILGGPYAAAYSTVVDDLDEDGITLAQPLLGGRPIPLVRGEPVRVEYALSGAARIAFLTTIESVHVVPLPAVRLAHPDPLRIARFQQRSFVRLPVSLLMRYRVVSTEDLDLDLPLTWRGQIVDLSASGVQAWLAEPLEEGEFLLIEFALGEEAFTLLAEVVRSIGEIGTNHFAHGLRFMETDEQQRQSILRYIFAQQRERRRQGLL